MTADNTVISNKRSGEATAIAKDLIKEFEGLRLTQYKCSGGMPTIGYGHVIRKNEQVASPVTEAQAEALLDQDVKIVQAALRCYCHVPLTPFQEAALISFIFNLGAGAFQSSTLRQKLNRSEYILAADEFPKWVHAGGRKLHGLVRRRAVERNLFLTEVEPETTRLVQRKGYSSSPVFGIIAVVKTLCHKLGVHIT